MVKMVKTKTSSSTKNKSTARIKSISKSRTKTHTKSRTKSLFTKVSKIHSRTPTKIKTQTQTQSIPKISNAFSSAKQSNDDIISIRFTSGRFLSKTKTAYHLKREPLVKDKVLEFLDDHSNLLLNNNNLNGKGE